MYPRLRLALRAFGPTIALAGVLLVLLGAPEVLAQSEADVARLSKGSE